MRRSPKLVLYGSLAGVFFFLALVLGRPELAALGAPFALVLIVGLSMPRPGAVEVSLAVQRERVFEGDEIEAALVCPAAGVGGCHRHVSRPSPGPRASPGCEDRGRPDHPGAGQRAGGRAPGPPPARRRPVGRIPVGRRGLACRRRRRPDFPGRLFPGCFTAPGLSTDRTSALSDSALRGTAVRGQQVARAGGRVSNSPSRGRTPPETVRAASTGGRRRCARHST